MSEYLFGVKRYTPEEQQKVNQEADRLRSGGSQTSAKTGTEQPAGAEQAEAGYYSGRMGDQQQAALNPQPMEQAEPEQPQPSTAWLANPANFSEVWTKFDQDPNYEDEHYSRQQIDQLYSYYSYRNPGKTMDQWDPLMNNDEFVTKVIEKENWYDPVKEEQIQQAAQAANLPDTAEIYNPTDPTKAAGFEKKEMGDWNQLDWIGKLFAAVTTNDEGVANMPSWTSKTQAAAQALSSAMAGPATLKIGAGILSMLGAGGAAAAIANPVVLIGAGLAVGGLTFYQALTKKEIPVFSKFLELSDLADTVTEHAIGYGAQAVQMAKQNIEQANADPSDAYGLMNAINDTIQDVGQHSRAMWDTGEYFYEMEGSIGDFAIDALKEIFKGETGTKIGEGWFFNRGVNEKQQLAEGTYGAEGMQNIREMYEEMEALGIEKDLQDSIIQQWVINTSGTSGNVSDYVAQMLLDLDVLSTPLQNEAAGVLSRATGDTNGIEATKTGRGSILSNAPVVGEIYQALTGKKPYSGINEWIDTRRDLARSTDVSKLTAADRFFGGIDADGKIREFARTERTGMTDLLPESKVVGVGNIANNVLNAAMSDVKDTNDIRNRLAELAGEANTPNEYRSGMNNSADVLTVRDGIRYAMQQSDPEIILKQFEASADARATLQKTADALGMQVKDVLNLYSETPAVFEQRVRNYAAEHNGMFADIDVSGGVDPISTIVKGFTTAKEGKGAPLAWDIRQVQYQITNSLIDNMAKYYTEYYGVKPGSVVNSVFDTMKSAQSLLLLGWSPSYFINNVVNNAVTSAAEGVMGFMTPKQIKQWMTAFGVTPARMDADLNSEYRGQSSTGTGGLQSFANAASEAKKNDDRVTARFLREVNGVLRQANDKLGIFSRLSGRMETLQGNQLTTVAIQQYWGQRWKRGEGFHLMPTALVEAIESQTPGMTDMIYQAIEGGLNMEAIGKTLFSTYVKPDAGTVMKTVCENLFRGEAKVYEEVFEKSGVMTEIKERYANCKTDDERAAVMDSIRGKIENFVANLRREALIERANDVAATVESEGLAPVAQMMSEMEMNHQDFWLRIRREEGDVMTRTQEMDPREARALKAEVFARHRNEFVDLYKQEISTAAGIMKGLGFQNEAHARYIGYMNEANQNWVNFNELKNKELQRAYQRTEAIDAAAGKGKKGDRIQKQEIWDEYHRNVSELYKDHFAKEMELSEKRDIAFVEGYEFATGKSGEQLRQNFKRIRDIRQRMYEMQQEAHQKTKDMTAEDKNAFYDEFNPRYNALIREIGNLGDANAQIVENAAEAGPGYENHTPVTMTPEETVRATETMEINNTEREKALRERQGYLDREGIRQGWIESGRTPAEADLMMTVYDALAETWAKDNGMYPDEFYSQAARLKGIASWLPGVQDTSVLAQTTSEYAAKYHDVIMQHYGTTEFREWFGQSKVVDEYGLPLVVHHGTNAQFEVFSKEKLGSNTGAASAKKGFFFASNPDTSAEYIPNPTKIWQAWKYVDIEEYLESNNNTAALLDDYSVSQLRSFAIEYTEKYQEAVNIFGDLVDVPTPEDFLNAINEYENKLLSADTESKKKYVQMMDNPYMYGFYFDKMSDCVTQGAGIEKGHVMDVYLSIQNPLVHDFKGRGRDISYSQLISQAISEGRDGVILKNTYDGGNHLTDVYVVFEPEQIKSIENDGTFNKLDPNILHQDAVNSIKGTFEAAEIGNIIRMLEASDVSTMVHESGHLFRKTLSTPLLTEFTQWAGYESVGEFQELEARFWSNDPTLTEAERTRYEESEEKFARGFEQYLMDGSAPTPGLKEVFKAFRDYLLDIYQKVKTTVAGNDYSQQGEFVFHGKTGDEILNINAEINGVRLRDIFDRMLTDDIQRIPGYQELIQNLRTQLSMDRHNMRMSDKALTRRAQVEVTKQILQSFGGMDAAESALQNYDLPLEINGWRVDDGTLHAAIEAAKADPQLNPFTGADWHEVKGTKTYAYSITEANTGKKYQLQYKIVELSDLVPSNVWFGDQLIVNEDYPADAQARNRSADQSDVYSHAANLNPGLLIDEQRAIDSGAPIVGEGNLYVESGNGRVLSLQYAHDHFPDQWESYQSYLREMAGEYGIDPEQLSSFENPVLIRERLGGDSVTFAEDANSNRNKVMTASENALTDANKVNMATLAALDIQTGESTDTFTTEKNAQPSVEWLRSLPEMERARYSTMNRNGDLILSTDGRTRFINALFATLYATPESLEIIRSFSETADSNIQALESALKQSLPEMARAEGLIQSGSRAANLSITTDVMAAAGLLQEARKAGINIHDFLAQSVIPGMERWTPTQALLAGFFGDAKNNVKKIRDFLNAYGEEVYKSGDPNQLSLFSESKTREQMINDSLAAALGNGQPTNAVAAAAEGPRLNQSVLDSDGKWSGQFAKVLNENQQRTFDDGLSLPLNEADTVYLRGEVNTKYETNVQRWLREFSNSKNLTADQYLYAWNYFEWWVQGSNGEAPKGNPIWEQKIQQMVLQDFASERGSEVSELQRRYRRGAEVDPTAVPNSGEYFKRVYGFEHGLWNIAGNVYKDGKLVAYLPEELAKMQKTIEVDGQSYHVLGIDMNNPEGLVYYDPVLEIVRTVNVGMPEGFEEPRNPFAFIRPAHQGATPQTMPVADAYSEIAQKYLYPALNAFGEAYKNADTEARTKEMSGLNLQTRAQIAQWLDQDVAEDMRAEKYRAMKYSDMKKDAAMLNYSQRYGFDPILTILSPYQFWYTRSMWKWAKRMIDKPALGNAYQRMLEYEDKNRQENLPSRLANRWRFSMPFLPDWMGGSYYVDLNAQLFPFAQFGQSFSSNMNKATLNARAEAILNEAQAAGDITIEEMQQAINNREGAVWENAYAQAELEIGRKDGIQTLTDQFISPSIFFTWAEAKQNGEDPGTLSGTRTGNAIKALTSDIPLISMLGSIVGDAMTIPEKALRQLYGFDYNEFGAYGDQQIRKQISQMCADGEIGWRQALNAMNEKSGTIWDMAADRQRKEAMMKVPGFAGAEAVKQMVKGEANVGQALGAMAISLLGGGSIYPEGEKTLREEKALKDAAYIRQANGDEKAVSEWYDEYPEYMTRTATYMSDPEELLKYTLYENIITTYYEQPYAQQQEILNELGPEFSRALMNKETRNYKAVPVEKLAEWNARIGNRNPAVGSIDVEGVSRVMQLSDQTIDIVTQHDELKDQLYPGISVIQNIYYDLPKDQRKSFIEQIPQLPEYWEWNREFKNDHPDYVQWETDRSAYYNESTLYNSYADMSQYTQDQISYAAATGNDLSSAALYELQQLYGRYANASFLSFEDYVKELMAWK